MRAKGKESKKFWNACEKGDEGYVQQIINDPTKYSTIDFNFKSGEMEDPPITVAIRKNHIKIVKMLLEKMGDLKIDLNLGKKWGAGPLYIACQEVFLPFASNNSKTLKKKNFFFSKDKKP